MIVHCIERNTRRLENQVIELNEFPLFPVFCLKKGLYIPPGPTGPCYKFRAKRAELQIRQGTVSDYQTPNFVYSDDKIRLREGDGDVIGTNHNRFIVTRLVGDADTEPSAVCGRYADTRAGDNVTG